MVYIFDSEVAKEYGVNEAIMIANFKFWILKNRANGKNFINGHYWTYNSGKAFLRLFPFWSEQTIRTVLIHLKKSGVIITANHNVNQKDRTLWYAFVDEEKWLGKTPEISICENQRMHLLKSTNAFVKTNKCILYDTDNIPDSKTDVVEAPPPKKKHFWVKGYSDAECWSALRGCRKLDNKVLMDMAEGGAKDIDLNGRLIWRFGEGLDREAAFWVLKERAKEKKEREGVDKEKKEVV